MSSLNSKRLVWLAAGAVALGFIVQSVAVPAIAQIRAALVKDVDNPIRQPFTVTRLINIPAGDVFFSVNALVVPVGKRAVLEHLACAGFTPSDTRITALFVRYTSLPADHVLFAVPVNTGTSQSGHQWVASQSLRAYADAGFGVQLGGNLLNVSMGQGTVSCMVSGHYVDLAF